MRLNRTVLSILLVVATVITMAKAATVLTIQKVTIVANVEKDSASVTVPANLNSVDIRLTDPNGVWRTTAGNIKQWGLQKSTDGGVTWVWGPVWQGDPNDSTTWIPFGTTAKDGGLPGLGMSSSDLVSVTGDRLRLAIITDANIVLGATITVQ